MDTHQQESRTVQFNKLQGMNYSLTYWLFVVSMVETRQFTKIT